MLRTPQGPSLAGYIYDLLYRLEQEDSIMYATLQAEQRGIIMVGNYPIVTLCGSTRFKEAFLEAQKRLTLEGYIVISVGLFGHSGDSEVWEGMAENTRTRTKEMLDDMHRRKIDMADEIYVINVDDYIGESTRGEIAYAREHGKIVRYLEPHIEQNRTAIAGDGDGYTSRLATGTINIDSDYAEAEEALRQMIQGTNAGGIVPADEATAAMIAYQMEESDEGADTEEDPQAGKKAYVVQMLRDGYDIGNTAYFIGEDEAFVRAVMQENHITDADLERAVRPDL